MCCQRWQIAHPNNCHPVSLKSYLVFSQSSSTLKKVSRSPERVLWRALVLSSAIPKFKVPFAYPESLLLANRISIIKPFISLISVLVPSLIASLQDPLKDKMPCLLTLRDTCFTHVVDAASLALIMPVLQRAFDDRSTEIRKTAAQIFGTLYSLARKEVGNSFNFGTKWPFFQCTLPNLTRKFSANF